MSAFAAWAVTLGAALVAVLCLVVTALRRDYALRRISAVMGVSIIAEIAIAELVPWGIMWVPLLCLHVVAMHLVLKRPASRVNVVIGALYAVAAAVDVVFAFHGDKAHAWSPYMDLLNYLTIAQAGALLTGVLGNGGSNRARSRNRGGRMGNFQSSGDMGLSR